MPYTLLSQQCQNRRTKPKPWRRWIFKSERNVEQIAQQANLNRETHEEIALFNLDLIFFTQIAKSQGLMIRTQWWKARSAIACTWKWIVWCGVPRWTALMFPERIQPSTMFRVELLRKSCSEPKRKSTKPQSHPVMSETDLERFPLPLNNSKKIGFVIFVV